eukprot:207669_1
MASDWKVPETPRRRVPLTVSERTINFEAAAFTQHEKLLWIARDRTAKFLDNKLWTDANLSKKRLYYEKCPPLSMEVYSPDPAVELRPLFKTVMNECKFQPCAIGESFGPSWASHWFKLILKPKETWDANGEIHLLWNSNTEATLWSADGICMQGLTAGTDQIRAEYMFSSDTAFPLTVYVEMACNNRFGCTADEFLSPPKADRKYKLEECALGWFNRGAWDLMWDMRMLHDVEQKLDKDSHHRMKILRATNHIMNSIDPLDESTYAKGRALASQILYGEQACDEFVVHAVGNCHIDTAWLWPYGETRRKVIRSWASQLRLMEEYEDYHFTASQAQQFAWLMEDCPELFARIQEVSDDTFHIVGGTWVEMDGNIPSGEGFVRQFLYGQEYFLAHFGRRCRIFWLPDTFGYSAQLPQIIRQSGIDYFLTQKLSWNLINKFPHHSFIWEGIDGSSVLTHFPPADTYVAQCAVKDVLDSRDNYKNKSCNNESLMLFGWGDGGGGPTTMHLERLKRYKKMRYVPRVKSSSPLQFFDELSKSADKLPTYVGELYFELHRGTYTTHAAIKKGNRQSESLLQLVEFIYTILSHHDDDIAYPARDIDRLWKLLLLNQFHDVLPGSSIELANIDARNIYDGVMIDASKLIAAGLMKLSACFDSTSCIVNSRSWKRREMLSIRNGDASILRWQDKKLSQTTYDKQTLVMIEADSYSLSPLIALPLHDAAMIEQKSDDVFVMQNASIYVEILSNGVIQSLIHKRRARQVIRVDANSDGMGGNNFLLFEDKPLFWEAWDVEIYHLQKYESVSAAAAAKRNTMKIIENGPLRCGVQFTMNISPKSVITQRIFVEAESSAVQFETDVDWNEKYKVLKVQFPLNIRSSVCHYDIQFGFVTRPTVMNNTEDIAKFEVVAHKWADLSEYDFGCALVNDSKYGYSCCANLLRLSLLRATKRPDANADIHRHFIRYCVLPHEETLQKSNVIQFAHNYNQQIRYCQTQGKKSNPNASTSFVNVNTAQVVADTIKCAQDNANDVIIRLYEAFGGRTSCELTVRMGSAVQKAHICNLLEDIGDTISVKTMDKEGASRIELYFEPFEIKTIRLQF